MVHSLSPDANFDTRADCACQSAISHYRPSRGVMLRAVIGLTLNVTIIILAISCHPVYIESIHSAANWSPDIADKSRQKREGGGRDGPAGF